MFEFLLGLGIILQVIFGVLWAEAWETLDRSSLMLGRPSCPSVRAGGAFHHQELQTSEVVTGLSSPRFFVVFMFLLFFKDH